MNAPYVLTDEAKNNPWGELKRLLESQAVDSPNSRLDSVWALCSMAETEGLFVLPLPEGFFAAHMELGPWNVIYAVLQTEEVFPPEVVLATLWFMSCMMMGKPPKMDPDKWLTEAATKTGLAEDDIILGINFFREVNESDAELAHELSQARNILKNQNDDHA